MARLMENFICAHRSIIIINRLVTKFNNLLNGLSPEFAVIHFTMANAIKKYELTEIIFVGFRVLR